MFDKAIELSHKIEKLTEIVSRISGPHASHGGWGRGSDRLPLLNFVLIVVLTIVHEWKAGEFRDEIRSAKQTISRLVDVLASQHPEKASDLYNAERSQ